MTEKPEAPTANPLPEKALDQASGGVRYYQAGDDRPNNIGGTDRGEMVFALAGNDFIAALGGDDIVYAGEDKDTVEGSFGKDVLYGEEGNDYLKGEQDDDALHGGEGDDVMTGGTGIDEAHGGAGDDMYTWDPRFDGNDFFSGGEGKNAIRIDWINGLDSRHEFTFQINGEDKGTWVDGDLVFKGPVSGSITVGGNTLTFMNVERITDIPKWW
jgi:Ca2+-binding RTX toxin-like protein